MSYMKDAAIDLHNNYDSMSVSELMVALVNKVIAMGRTRPVKYVGFPNIESAIRKAVIREDVVHCGECRYGVWETQEPFGIGEGIACHVIAGRSRPWLGAVTDYCSEGSRKEVK